LAIGRNKAIAKDAAVKEEDDPYAGFGTEEVAAPLQVSSLLNFFSPVIYKCS
jgi:hypothetical protein